MEKNRKKGKTEGKKKTKSEKRRETEKEGKRFPKFYIKVDGDPMVLEDCEFFVDVAHQVTILKRVEVPPSS